MTTTAPTEIAAGTLSLLLAGAPIAISLFGLFYVRRQTIQARQKLSMELYDKRFKVYSAAKRFIHFVSRDLKVSDDERRLFLTDTQEVDFLFRDDMVKYIDQLRDVAQKLKSNMGRLERAQVRGDEIAIDKSNDDDALLTKRLTDLDDQLKPRFKQYLNLGNIT